MAYAVFDTNDVIVALYKQMSPPGAEKVPSHVLPGWRRVDGQFVPPQLDPVELEEMRRDYLQSLNQLANQARNSENAQRHAEKKDEALEVQRMEERGEDPNALSDRERVAMFPLLAASIGLEVDTLISAADLILRKNAHANVQAHAFERALLQGNRRLREADTATDVEIAYQNAAESLAKIGTNDG